MRDIAAWVVASPQNAVLALSVTMLVPILQPISCIILVLMVLGKGPRLASSYVALASVIVVLLAAVLGRPAGQSAIVILLTWAPIYMLAAGLLATRSLTLTLQGSVIVAVFFVVLLNLLIADPVTFWQPITELWSTMMAQSGAPDVSQDISSPEFAERVAGMLMVSAWMIYTLVFMLGYIVYGKWADNPVSFGRIRDLNFGRVLASILVLIVVLSYVISISVIQNAADMFFAVFWMQGIALAYWFFAEQRLPLFAVLTICVLSLVIVYVAVAMTVLGYLDAWFDLRRRFIKAEGLKK